MSVPLDITDQKHVLGYHLVASLYLKIIYLNVKNSYDNLAL